MEVIFNNVEELLIWLECEKESNFNHVRMTASMKNFIPCYKLTYSL